MEYKMKNKLFTLSVFVLLFSILNCKGSQQPFVIVDGTKYTESDLKKELPQYYAQIRSEYEDQIKRALDKLGQKKLFDLAAKEKKFTNGDAYLNSLNNNAATPSEEEITKTFKELQTQGQLKGQKLDQVRGQIVNYLRSLKSRDVVQVETSALRKKYGYTLGPDERKEIKIAGKPTWHPNGKVLVVEFSGYDCPFCKKVQTTTKQIREKYGDKVKWVFKDYPLNPADIHHHTSLNCVFDQSPEKFFMLFDKIYTVTDTRSFVEKSNLDKQIEGMGLDMKKYKVCVDSPTIKDRIMSDYNEGQSLGVRGIPHFFINGKGLSGAQPAEAFEQMINVEL